MQIFKNTIVRLNYKALESITVCKEKVIKNQRIIASVWGYFPTIHKRKTLPGKWHTFKNTLLYQKLPIVNRLTEAILQCHADSLVLLPCTYRRFLQTVPGKSDKIEARGGSSRM